MLMGANLLLTEQKDKGNQKVFTFLGFHPTLFSVLRVLSGHKFTRLGHHCLIGRICLPGLQN
jgi:hypothetical protein